MLPFLPTNTHPNCDVSSVSCFLHPFGRAFPLPDRIHPSRRQCFVPQSYPPITYSLIYSFHYLRTCIYFSLELFFFSLFIAPRILLPLHLLFSLISIVW